jgi:hypothetical protein
LIIILCGSEKQSSAGSKMFISRREIDSFSECSRGDSTYESCFPYADVCIWRGLFNDSYVNCPMNCFDEGGCYRAPGKLSGVGVIIILDMEFTHMKTLL